MTTDRRTTVEGVWDPLRHRNGTIDTRLRPEDGVIERPDDGRSRVSLDAVTLREQRRFSLDVFGPGQRVEGLIEHITKELDEIRRDPADLAEYVDVMILAVDGALRQGHSPAAILNAYHEKLSVNYRRRWPDWRTFTDGQAIEHVRGEA